MPLSSQTSDRLRSIVESACEDPKTGIPGVSVVVVDKNGTELFAQASGKRGVESDEPMTLDNVYWIASCTKMLTGLACMQLVEQGRLALDDGDQTETLLPELKSIQVLRPDGKLEEKKNQITLRMLLAHTAGFGYSFFNESLRDWTRQADVDEFNCRLKDILTPLSFQPGEGWQYGVSIDWAGIALERKTGLSLNDYLQQNVFQPLGIKDMSLHPGPEMLSKLASMHRRDADGKIWPRDHLSSQPPAPDPTDDPEMLRSFSSGGAGMFARPQEYTKVLAVLLNDGVCPRTGAQLLRKETVDEMFRNQVPEFPDFGRQGIPAAKPELTNPIPDLYPVADRAPQGWGLTFMLSNGGPTGRSRTTAFWAGLANLWWWCDREKGVAGLVCTQIFPFADAKVLGLWFELESEIYRGLLEEPSDESSPKVSQRL